MTVHHLSALHTLILSILVLFLGMGLTRRLPTLGHHHVPPAVVGGILCSLVVVGIQALGGVQVSFDMQIRDVLLLAFFSTIGLNAKLRMLAEGGRGLAIMLGLAFAFLMIQDLTGVLVATGLGGHPGYGLFAGSVSLAGGHGTAIAWGDVAEKAGLEGAAEIGIAFATFGMIAGGLIGGPLGGWLIERWGLAPAQEAAVDEPAPGNEGEIRSQVWSLEESLGTLLLLALCIAIGDSVNQLLFAQGVLLPGFLASLLVGIVITNLSDVVKIPINQLALDRAGEVSLQVFLSMSLMSLQLYTLASALGVILLALFVQILVITLFATLLVFRSMGRDYDAAVMAAGFVGMGLGATPVAIANMQALTARFGASPKAFLIVPLVGAFFIDLLNAAVIKFTIGRITSWMG